MVLYGATFNAVVGVGLFSLLSFRLSMVLLVTHDQSIASTKTKYVKLKTKTQILFLITFDFCIHFKKENFFFSLCFLVPPIVKSSYFHLNNKKYFGF